MGIEKGEDVLFKSIDNIFIKITENFLNHEKERLIQVQNTFKAPNQQDQKRKIPRYIIIKELNV
jgi:hypothetical protein